MKPGAPYSRRRHHPSSTHRASPSASTKNMDLKHTAGYTTTYNVRSKGEDKKHIIVFFPTGIPDMKEAIDNAIEKNGPNCVGLSNATLERKWFYIPFIYGQESFVAEGDPIMRKN